MKEIWKPVVGYEGWYSVSSLGKIRREKTGNGTWVGRILKPVFDSDGYVVVSLSKMSVEKLCKVHVLVMKAFIGNPLIGHQVNHKNGIKSNNLLSNLEYVTNSENRLHAFKIGLSTALKGEKNCFAKLKKHEVYRIRNLWKTKKFTQRRLGIKFNISQTTIWSIVNNRTWRCI